MSDNITLRDIESWLSRSSGQLPAEEVLTIRQYLVVIGEEPASAKRQLLLEGLHLRAGSAIETLLPRLYNVRLPISSSTRQTVRSMQDALDTLARLELEIVESPDAPPPRAPTMPIALALWRVFEALTQHLTLANLIAAPASPGTWVKLHRAYLAAWRHQAGNRTPTKAPQDLQTVYARALILGSLPPSALNAHEWAFLHRFLDTAKAPLTVTMTPDESETTLWVSPDIDTPPMLIDRRAPRDGTLAFFVQCSGILAEIKQALTALLQDNKRPSFLPDDTSTRTARIALRRLRDHLSLPRKRRFNRRRQGYRAALCVGFEEICLLLKTGIESQGTLTEWMIVNESPGGYAAMHVSGKPRKAQVGDLVALRRAEETQWSINVVRWALSENPEHLEFGLEEISPSAISGHMTTPGLRTISHPQALLLPAVPPLRVSEAIALSPANQPKRDQSHIFIADGKRAEIREFRLGRPIEQSSGIDISLISPL